MTLKAEACSHMQKLACTHKSWCVTSHMQSVQCHGQKVFFNHSHIPFVDGGEGRRKDLLYKFTFRHHQLLILINSQEIYYLHLKSFTLVVFKLSQAH